MSTENVASIEIARTKPRTRKPNGERIADLSVRLEGVQGAIHTAAQLVLDRSTGDRALQGLYGVLELVEKEIERINDDMVAQS